MLQWRPPLWEGRRAQQGAVVADGLLGGLLGTEDQDPEIESAADSLIAAEAFAAAVAADQAKRDATVADATAHFLRAQSLLLQIQARHLEDEHGLRLSQLRGQARDGVLRRLGQRLRIGIQAATALALAVVGVGLAVMLADAFSSRSVVVDVFKAPSALAGRGVTGDVVASGVLDALQKLQAATHSASKTLDSKNAWASDVKIEVPETGVSIGEVERLLHARFSHDLHIDGDLVQTEGGGLALTVRGDGVPAKTFQGAAADLDKLTTQAAEYVYGRSQPYQFQNYLTGVGRFNDTLAFLPGAVARATSDAERAELANGWGNAYLGLNQPGAAIPKYRLVLALAPRESPVWWKAWSNLIAAVAAAQGEEAAWREGRAELDAVAAAPKAMRPQTRYLYNAAQNTTDLPLVLAAALQDSASNAGAGASLLIEGPTIADAYALLHDPTNAARYMAASDPDDSATKAEAPVLAAEDDVDRGDAAAAVAPLEGFWKTWQTDTNIQFTFTDTPCFLGLAYGMAGRLAEAEAVFKRMGPLSRCAAFHGDVLAHAGDLAGAERAWDAGLKLAPDLPLIWLHRGLSELNRGDLRDAQADLAVAHAKAPHFADPLKAWGDLLAGEGRWKDALAKYDEALAYAPTWTALRQARDAAARRA